MERTEMHLLDHFQFKHLVAITNNLTICLSDVAVVLNVYPILFLDDSKRCGRDTENNNYELQSRDKLIKSMNRNLNVREGVEAH